MEDTLSRFMTKQSVGHLAVAAAALLGSWALAAAAQEPRTFRVADNGGSRVQFLSEAPLETITGVTSKVKGELTVDLQRPARTRGRVVVDVASLRTGIELRDEHLRGSTWLDSARYPEAIFEITGVDGIDALPPNQIQRARVRGRFTLHGQTQNVTANARIRYMPLTDEMRQAYVNGDVIVVQARFKVKLADHGVSIPPPVRLKVAEEVTVSVVLRAVI